MATPADRIARELEFLRRYPHFEQRPATVAEFLGPDYLNIADGVRPRLREVLVDMLGHEVSPYKPTRHSLALFTGGIGAGKTTVASVVLPYMAHWMLCLRDPQAYFDLLPGSRIAFMLMSTSETQAKQVLFTDIEARIKHSPWFRTYYPKDPTFKNQIRFGKDVWIIPGDSKDTTFEGYNIFGGIIDEADSHMVTEEKDYAESGFRTIHARISSRFGSKGFLLIIGQKKKQVGFVARKHIEFEADPNAYAVSLAIWESLGWDKFKKADGARDSFFYDVRRKIIVPHGAARMLDSDNIIEIPNVYKKDFQHNPEEALKDHAGIPPTVSDPFISLDYKITQARDRWVERHGPKSPVDPYGRLRAGFQAPNTLPRVLHLDMAYAAGGDSLGMAMGHVLEVRKIDSETKPYIVFDLLMRWRAPAGGEIFLGDVRKFIYELKEQFGFQIKKVTCDGFESTDTQQQLRRRRFAVEEVSVDKSMLPYHDLREAIYEDRVEFPLYLAVVRDRSGYERQVEIAVKELMELEQGTRKIDHPASGSKDLADAMAGVVYTLMGDPAYRRKVTDLGKLRAAKDQAGRVGAGYSHPSLGRLSDLRAPVPPPLTQAPGWDSRYPS